MSDVVIRPRRSALYMPGANERALEKAKSLSADMLILDLEDAVAPDAKVEARERVAAVVSAGGYCRREVLIRINALSTEWGGDDIAMAAGSKANGVLAPKVDGAADVKALDEALSANGAPDDFALWVMIETPLSILNIHDIAAASASTRLAGFVMGTNDLAKDMRASMANDRLAFLSALSMSVTAARAYGLVAIDGVFNDIADTDGFAAECEQGQILGFDGKTLIHPSQIETCNETFSPSDQEIAQSRAIIAAFADPANAGAGVIKVDGKMTERLHLQNAERIVAVADAIAAAG